MFLKWENLILSGHLFLYGPWMPIDEVTKVVKVLFQEPIVRCIKSVTRQDKRSRSFFFSSDQLSLSAAYMEM
jgi:hypothetical protein